MGIQIQRIDHPSLIAFRLTLEDGSQKKLFCKPRPEDPDGTKFLERAIASIRLKRDKAIAERSRSFV